MVKYAQTLDQPQITASCFKVDRLALIKPDRMMDKLNEGFVDWDQETPRRGFLDVEEFRQRNELHMSYMVEMPERYTVAQVQDGALVSEPVMSFSVKVIEAHLRLSSSMLVVYSGDGRAVNPFLSDLARVLEGISIEKFQAPDKFLDDMLRRSDNLVRVKLDRLKDSHLTDVTLRGDALHLSGDFREYHDDRSGELSEIQVRYTTPLGKTVTMILSKAAGLRVYTGKNQLDWEDFDEVFKGLEKGISASSILE